MNAPPELAFQQPDRDTRQMFGRVEGRGLQTLQFRRTTLNTHSRMGGFHIMSTKVLTIIVSTLATVAAIYPDLAGAALGGEPVNYEAGSQVQPHIYDVRP
ncbi:hypothetical protein GSH04_27780, partial [Burkholderia pseudomallei]|nr:hypothetical protein [Burkholderia pseudomallei]